MTFSVRGIVASLLLLGALLVLQLRSTGEAVPVRKEFDTFPPVIGTWQARASSNLGPEIVNFLNVNDYVLQSYATPTVPGVALRRLLGDPAKGPQIHSPQNCFREPAGNPSRHRYSRVLPAPYAPITVNRYLLRRTRARWYSTGTNAGQSVGR